MTREVQAPSARKGELLEAAYQYVLQHGLAEMSLRPLAAAIGSSPRVLLFLFGSKDGLIRELLARARTDELRVLDGIRASGGDGGPDLTGEAIWTWLAAPEHRGLLTLWVEAYGRSLVDPDGPWAGFAARTVHDWLAVLDGRTGTRSAAGGGPIDQTLLLAVLRGALLDLLATGDIARTTAAVGTYLERTGVPTPPDRRDVPSA